MAGNKVTTKLTDEQQIQIETATGKRIRELNIDLAASGDLTKGDLDKVAGGNTAIKPW